MDEATRLPSRRTVLVLAGGAIAAPTAWAVGRSHLPGGDTTEDGLRFEVLGTSRRTIGTHSHHAAASPVEQMSWSDVVRTSLHVSNVVAWPLLVSPGQFRLRVDDDLSVMPSAWEHGPTALVGGRSRTGWIDFRAPAGERGFHLEFTAAGRFEPVSVTLAVPGSAA